MADTAAWMVARAVWRGLVRLVAPTYPATCAGDRHVWTVRDDQRCVRCYERPGAAARRCPGRPTPIPIDRGDAGTSAP
jgi:hypothetical protein